MGLQSFAFDPDYETNGRIYVSYSYNDGSTFGPTRLSRFTNDDPSDLNIDVATEEVLLEVPQTTNFHKSFSLAFGPDNLLYIATGDGGPQGDTENRSQDTSKLFGKVLRIDVSGTTDTELAYHIPETNPFYKVGPAGGDTRKEILAYGFRNPWKISFDRINGYLFLGDVGFAEREEVNVVEAGKNYGWNIFEGSLCVSGEDCDTSGIAMPLVEYDHEGSGAAVTGGFVYYGSEFPELVGIYIYSDFVKGRVWGLKYDGKLQEGPFTLVGSARMPVVSLFQDNAGEIYFLGYNGEGTHKLKRTTGTLGSDFPVQLSDIPDLLKAGRNEDLISSGIYPYEPSAKLWSDGTYKTRLFALPYMEQMEYTEADGWNFPEQSLLIKNFALPMDRRDPVNSRRLIETRLLLRLNEKWHGFTYEWDEAQTDAQLLTFGKTTTYTVVNENGENEVFTHLFPSRNQCLECHTAGANWALGPSTAYMNFDYPYPKDDGVVVDNQLRTYNHIGLFTEELPDTPENLPRMPDPFDETEPLQDRARAYLAANCSYCHRPAGTTPASIDLRWEATNIEMNAFHQQASLGNLGATKGYILNIPEPPDSVLYRRISRRDDFQQMPPFGTNIVHDEGVELIEAWLTELQQRDRNKIMQHLLGQPAFAGVEAFGADLNEDDVVDISDGLLAEPN